MGDPWSALTALASVPSRGVVTWTLNTTWSGWVFIERDAVTVTELEVDVACPNTTPPHMTRMGMRR
jgi:hypothetical protein